MVPNAGAEKVERLSPRNARLHLDLPLIIFFCLVLCIFVFAHLRLEQRYDFGIFYYAAHMLLDGARHSLYDINAQHAFQSLYHRPPDTLFRNPPVALLPILPLAKLAPAAAFSVWTAISLVLLFAALKMLQDQTEACYGNWPILVAPMFMPVMSCFLHGQFSILIVASFALTYALWRRGRLILGGFVLSIALIKFQLVIGLVAILALKRKVRELAGLACGAVLLLALSIGMVGPRTLLSYPHFVLHSDTPIDELPHMADWHGFLTVIGLNRTLLLLLLCMATIAWAAAAWKDLDRGFGSAIIATLLVSYHLTPQDLSVLIVPFYLCIHAGVLPKSKVSRFTGAAMLGLFAIVMFHVPFALLALPLACALWWVGKAPPHSGPMPEAIQPAS